MGCLNDLCVRTLDQAESAAGVFFEPIRDEADTEPILHLEILHVSCSDIDSRHPRNVMAVHV